MTDNTEKSQNEDLQKTLETLHQAAADGNAKAQFKLGMLYANGDEVDLSYSKAADLIMAAAESGLLEAQSTMGWLYANGYGVQQDDESAGYWYLQAANQGSAKDEFVLGTMYRFGQLGSRRDMAQSIHWYQKAANRGFAPAQFALGKMIMDGKHVEKDSVTAFQWLSLAHANGSKKAEATLKTLLQSMTPEEVEAAKKTIGVEEH